MPMHDLCIWHPLYRWFKSSSYDTLMHPTSSMWQVYVDILQCRCMIHVFDTTNTSGSGQVPTHISKHYLCRQFKSTRLDVLICYIVNTLRYLTTPMRAIQIVTPWHSYVSCVQHCQWEWFKSTSLVTLMCHAFNTFTWVIQVGTLKYIQHPLCGLFKSTCHHTLTCFIHPIPLCI